MLKTLVLIYAAATSLAFGQQDIESNVYQDINDKVHGDFSNSAPLVSPKKEIEELQTFMEEQEQRIIREKIVQLKSQS